MADFDFKSWLKLREKELPSLLSKQRKKFDLTANTWMEDPEIYAKAQKAASIDKGLAKLLAFQGDNPELTDEIISRINKAGSQFPVEEAEQIAKSEIGSDLSNILGKRVEELKRTTIPETMTEDQLKYASRYSSPRVLNEAPEEVKSIFGIKEFKPEAIEVVESSALNPAQVEQSSKYTSGRVIPGGSEKLDEIMNVKPFSAKDIEPKGFTLGEGTSASNQYTPEQIRQIRLQNALKANPFTARDLLTERVQMPNIPISIREVESSKPVIGSEEATGAEAAAEEAVEEAASKTASAESAASQMGDDAAELAGSIKDEMLSGKPDVNKLKKAKGIFERAYEAEKNLIGKYGKYAKPIGSLAGKALGAYGAYEGAKGTMENIERGDYTEALGDALLGAGGALGTIGRFSPVGLGATVGGLTIKAGTSLGKMISPEDYPAEYEEKGLGIDRTADIDEKIKKTYSDELPEEEFEEEIFEAPSYDDEEEPEVEEPSTEAQPSATPEPSPVLEQKPTSSISDKIMNILGMPTAYAEEMPKQQAEQAKPVKQKTFKNAGHAQNYTYNEALKMGMHPAVPLSVIPVESRWNFNSKLRSTKGAFGTTQVTPWTVLDLIQRKNKIKFANTEEGQLQKQHFNTFISNLETKLGVNSKSAQKLLADPKYAIIRDKGVTSERVKDLFSGSGWSKLVSNLGNLDTKDNISTGIGIMKLKASDLGLDPTDEKNIPQIVRSYNGRGPGTFKYLKKVKPYLEKNIKLIKNFEQADDAIGLSPAMMAFKNAAEKIATSPFNITSPLNKSSPVSIIPSALMEKFGPKFVSEEEKKSINLPFSDEQEPAQAPTLALTEEDSGSDDGGGGGEGGGDGGGEGEGDGYAYLDLLKTLQNESKDEKIRDLMAMQNLLNAQSNAAILKGMATAASGLIGSTKKNKGAFVTVPELKGLDVFDEAQRGPASMMQFNEMMKKQKYDDPTSAVSLAYQKFAEQTLRRIDPESKIPPMQGLSANSILKLLPNAIKEDSLLYRKLLKESANEAKITAADVKEDRTIAKNLQKSYDKFLGSGGSKLINDSLRQEQLANKLLHSILALPDDVSAEDLKGNKLKDTVNKLNKLDKIRVAEATVDLANILTGGTVAAQGTLNKLMTSSARSDFAQAFSYWAKSGKPMPANLGESLANFAKMAISARDLGRDMRQDMLSKSMRTIESRLNVNPNYKDTKSVYDQIMKDNDVYSVQDYENIKKIANDPGMTINGKPLNGNLKAAKRIFDDLKAKKGLE